MVYYQDGAGNTREVTAIYYYDGTTLKDVSELLDDVHSLWTAVSPAWVNDKAWINDQAWING